MRRYEIVGTLGATTVRLTFKLRADATHHARTLAEQGWKVSIHIVSDDLEEAA